MEENEMKKFTEKELEMLADQLSCPEGDLGIKMGEKMNNSNSEMTFQTMNNLSFEKKDKVLELGHGNAGHLQNLMDRATQLEYFGLELSSTMKSEAVQINANFVSEQKANFQLFDGLFIPFSENSFQKIFSVNTIYFWQKPNVLLSEIFRVLEVGGTFAITFAKKEFMQQLPFTKYGFRLWDILEVIEIVTKIGFQHLETIELEDNVESKSEEFVNRKYVVMKFRK